MKKTILLLLVTLFAFNSNAQVSMETITNDVCGCIDAKKEKLQNITSESLKMQLGLCILSTYTKNTEFINATYGKIMENQTAMEKFGGDIGMKMVTVCPETLMSIAGASDYEEDSTAVSEERVDLFVEGKVTEIKSDQFVSIQVKDKNARIHNFLLLDYFDTASLYTDNQIKVKDNIKVSYTEIELYDPKGKEFRYFKVITGLEKQ